jgi:HEAT repeat protein
MTLKKQPPERSHASGTGSRNFLEATGFVLALLLLAQPCGAEEDIAGGHRVAAWHKEADASKDPEAVWMRAAEDPGEAVKIEAARELDRVGTERALPALRRLAAQTPKIMMREGPAYSFNTVAQYAINRIEARMFREALIRDFPETPARVQRAIRLVKENPNNPDLLNSMKQFLVEAGTPEALEALLTMRIDPDTASRLANRVKTDQRLIDVMLSRVRLVDQPVPEKSEERMERREWVYGALRFFTELADVRYVPELLRALDIPETVDVDLSLMIQARSAVAACGPQALPILENFYRQTKSRKARQNAVVAAAYVGGKEAIAFLEGALRHEEALLKEERITEIIAAQIERLKRP